MSQEIIIDSSDEKSLNITFYTPLSNGPVDSWYSFNIKATVMSVFGQESGPTRDYTISFLIHFFGN